MERPSSTRGSPSEQLTAFDPIGYEAFAHRGNPVPFPGVGSVRPIGDPFANWSNELRMASTITSQTTPTSSASGYAYAPQAFEHSNALAQIAPATLDVTLDQANTHASGNRFEYSSTSSQLSPTNAGSGGVRYSPSHVQASRSVNQMQYLPHASTHRRMHLGDPRYLLSPVQTAIANTRYSPSREQISYEYSPTPAFISNLFATTHDPVTGDANAAPANAASPNAPIHGNIDHQAGCNTGITASRSFSGGIHDATEKNRSFIVHNVSLDTSHRSIIMMFPIEEYPSLENVCLKQLGTKGVFSFSFGDLREAINAMNKIRSTRPGWRVFPSTAREIANLNGTNGPSASALSDGAFLLSVFVTKWLMKPMDGVVENVVASLGKLRSCKLIENGTNMSRYHVEYFNVRHAAYAFSCLGGFRLDSLHFDVSPIDAKEEPALSHNQTPSRVSPRSPVTPYHLVSKENEIEEKIDISPASEEGKTNPEHAIDLDRIRHGLDVRSTVMIRNIPNKLSSEQLQRIIDESSYGKYDFLYLRMDFTHRCNVGYAFMNFGDPIDILDLVRAREGKTWPSCISEKRTEISYATLQGKDALISKFRNSNVMTRPHEERPRLFHIDGPRAGTEMAFPGPNDASKLRRSVASTTQQGLFAPRTRGPTTPHTNRIRPQSQSFGQTPRGRGSIRTSRHSAGRSVQHAPGEFASMQTENRQFTSQRN
ncbi:Meiosis protein MEI2 [Penicillium robsamsonii]|uniref:Meiosis protein MEI2 n=1 Tax=Penicillium robsamsonii TaxID=1792511 RepID=UPI00254856CD|nr:Meiosis protein MEI2 [Penicillium robsamsonii]KAJ5822902.1 Meiosis protein MEI2 [Penicillium robsamsonii]